MSVSSSLPASNNSSPELAKFVLFLNLTLVRVRNPEKNTVKNADSFIEKTNATPGIYLLYDRTHNRVWSFIVSFVCT
jgi:hypothetical protein